MKIELLGILPESQAVITCEGVKTCDKVSVKKEGLVGDLQLTRVGDELNCCRLKRVIDNEDKMDCNELIAYWMMEGYLGHVDSVKEAYKKGHELFMDFKYVKMPRSERYEEEMFDSLASDTTYKRYREFFYSTLGLGFVDVFDDFHEEAPKFGELVPDNGALRSFTRKNERSSCLLLDGNQLGRHVLGYFNESLKHFAYFNPRANILQSALKPHGLNLSVLVLRGCAFLEEIDPCIGGMTALTVLEISDSSSIKTIPDIFKKTTNLRSLNLSYLGIETLPKNSFAKLVNLRWIILRGCSRLTELPSTRDMAKLEVIDLYGATSLKRLSTTNFRKHPIKMLDLSNTHATRVPCLFDFASPESTTITHLFLRNCLKIYVFDIVVKLLKLQVLDVSGSEHLKQISINTLEDLVVLDLSRTGLSSLPPDCFAKLKKLKVLNLSKTNISSMPDISHLSGLLRLIVQGCESLETLQLEGLESLQFLDVSGCKKLQGWKEIAFGQWPSLLSLNLSDTCIKNFIVLNSNGASSSRQHLELLQILDLSKTSTQNLPSMSQLKSLKQLLLAGCSELSSVPDLEFLTELEVLDLSGTKIKKEFLQKAPSSLRKLFLKDCSRIEGSLPVASLTLLQELDLRGSNVAELPEDIAGMTHLKCLRLPHKMDITRVDWRRMKDCRLNELYWDQLNIFDSVKVLISSDTEHSMSAKPSNDSHLFRLVDSQDQWEAYFKQFQFSVSPKEENKDAEIHFGGVELVFKGHHPLARKAPYIKPQCRAVEIHGFSSFSEDTKSGLKQAVNVALVGNSFISSLSDEYFQHMEAMKVCWINSCTEMKFILGGENQNASVLGGLETLVLSNLASLESFSAESENVPSQSIVPLNLKHMYIDCCPVLNKIISSSHLPENLETLHIKFCDKLEDVCGGNTSTVSSEPEAAPGGSTSNVGDKPEAAPDGNPSNSGDAPATVSSGSTSHVSDEIEAVSSGNTSHASDEIQAVSGGNTSNVGDKLDAVSGGKPSDVSGELEGVSGGKTSNVGNDMVDGCGGNDSKCSLPKLHELSLLGLPKLLRIGADLPSLQTLIISQCPELELDIFGSILQCARSRFTRLSLDSCPKLTHVLSSSMLPENLQRLEIRSCDKLTTVFDSAGLSSSTSLPSLRSLRHLQLWNLPQLKMIGGDFPSLEDCEIKYCSRLPQGIWPKVKTQI